MNNPFVRLKHFIPEQNDPQENHATECLAACLVFSPRIRASFIRFLFDDKTPFQLAEESEAEVLTQQSIEGGYVDLVLGQGESYMIAVEVKVKSPENCEHHRSQLSKYRAWLNSENMQHGYLFTLVRNPDTTFFPSEFQAKRHSWWDFYKHCQAALAQPCLSDVETNLIKNLCEYLESEGIVSVYETKDLLFYANGLRAQKAITAIFNQVASRLQADKFESEFVEGKKDAWPFLRVRHPDWTKIFGAGKNRKVSLWFMVPGTWEADRHDFWWDIELWNQDDGNDWAFTKPKLQRWLDFLKSDGFDWTVAPTWGGRQLRTTQAKDIQTVPARIFAFKGGHINKSERIINVEKPQNEDELIDLLVKETKQYAETVSSMAKLG